MNAFIFYLLFSLPFFINKNKKTDVSRGSFICLISSPGTIRIIKSEEHNVSPNDDFKNGKHKTYDRNGSC